MPRQPKEFQAFTSLVDKLLTVQKSDVDARVAAERKKAALNPRKRGPKPKGVTPSTSDASHDAT